MGYFNNQEVSQQGDVDRIVAWYSANKDVPNYLLNRVLSEEKLMWEMVEAWESLPTPSPKRQRKGRRSTYRKPGVDPATIGAIGIVLAIWIIVLTAVAFLGGL